MPMRGSKLPSSSQLLALARSKGYGGMKKPAPYRRKGYYKKKKYPARFNASKRTYNLNYRVAKAMNKMSENKLLQTQPFDGSAPVAIRSGEKSYYWGGVIQSIPSSWDTNLNNLAGIVMTQGLSAQQRIGNYVFYKKTHIVFQIDMLASSDFDAATQFRFIVAKSRQLALPAGLTDTPQTSLFLNNIGGATGHAVTAVTAMDLMNQPLNKRDWVVYKDFKFTLSPNEAAGGGFNFKYPSRKDIPCDLKYYCKTRIHPTTNTPEDLDAHYIIYIYSSSIGKNRSSSHFQVSTRGTTSYSDN